MFRHIGSRFIAIIIPSILIITTLVYLSCTKMTREIILNDVQSSVQADQMAHTSLIENKLMDASQIVDSLSMAVGMTYQNTSIDTYKEKLSREVEKHPFILGAGIWFEPYEYNKSEKYVGPYIYRKGSELQYTDIYESEEYDYLNQDFYILPKTYQKTVFTKAYYDQNLGTYLLTCSAPIFDDNNNYLGCITADIELSSLQNIVRDYNKEHNSDLVIVSEDGSYMAAEEAYLAKKYRSFLSSGDEEFQKIAQNILDTDTGVEFYQKDSEKMYLYYDTIEPMGWKIIYEISESVVNEPLEDLNKIFVIISLLATIIVLVLILVITNRSIINPLKALDEDLSRFNENSGDCAIPAALEGRKDEFGRMGETLYEMKSRLIEYREDMAASMEELTASEEEIKQQNESLIKKEQQLVSANIYNTAIIEAMPDTVFVISQEGIFTDCQGNTSFLYVPREGFIGKSLYEILPTEIAAEGIKKIKDVIKTGNTEIMEYELKNEKFSGFFEIRFAKCKENSVVGVARDITKEHYKAQEIEYLSFHDQVTGLYNRRYFEYIVKKLPEENKYPIGIVMADVNGLKFINDSFGHAAGDELLIKLSEVLIENTDSDCIVSRIGGDEFVILLPGRDEHKVQEYIKALESATRKEVILGLTLSVALGQSVLNDSQSTIRQMLKIAEDKMYQKKLFEAYSRQSNMIEVIMKTLQEKNPREEQHSKRVAEICEKLAVHMKMDYSSVQRIKHAAMLHDIGKIGIPEGLLNKEGALTDEEYVAICKHSEIGYRILQSVSQTAEISEMVLYHHEKWNGTGYPRGLSGEEIPIESRMIAIADAYDAMTSDRSYRKGMPSDMAMKEILRCSGTQFDPMMVEAIYDLMQGDYHSNK